MTLKGIKIGPYLNSGTLQPGDIPCMVLSPTDSGPFWMNPDEQKKKAYIIVEGNSLRENEQRNNL